MSAPSTPKPIFDPLQQAKLEGMDRRQEQRATPWVSEWQKVVKGQKFNIEHKLGRTPNVVQLEFSSNGKDIDGSCAGIGPLLNNGTTVSRKDAREIALQAGASYAGVRINQDGTQTGLTEGWVRVVGW